MAAGDLTTLARLKVMLGIDVTEISADPVLSLLITSQSALFLQQIDRPLAIASYTETLDGHSERIKQRLGYGSHAFAFGGFSTTRGGGYAITLRYTPVVSITSLTIDGNPIPQGSSANTPAQVDGWTINEDRIEMLGCTYLFTPGIGNVVINYTAGYAATPADVEQAIWELVDYRYKERDHRGQRSKDIGGGQTVYFQMDGVPPSVQTTIDQYKRRKF